MPPQLHLAMLAVLGVPLVSSRQAVLLDGPEWDFVTDTNPSDPTAPIPPPWVGASVRASVDTGDGVGTSTAWQQQPPPWEQSGPITVPGCWSSATSALMTASTAYGNATPTRSHHYIGLAWYSQ
jgi:hypothetical protein